MSRFRSKTCTRVLGFDGRGYHLVDAENLVGGPAAPTEAIQQMWRKYRGGVPATKDDHIYLGGSSFFAKRAMAGLPNQGLRLRIRDGKDGADSALIDSSDIDYIAKRFDRLIIASGDGIFEDLALQARARGMHVQVVYGIGALSTSLARAATTVSQLKLEFANPEAHRGARRWQRTHAQQSQHIVKA